MERIVALAGGVGAAKLLRGLVRLVPSPNLVIVGNTGDDFEIHGLHVSADLDIVMYTLAGIVDEQRGWGIANDSFNCLDMLGKLGFETWFKLGDRDMATHVTRTKLISEGRSLSEATAELCKRLGIEATLIPFSNDPVRTKIISGSEILEFQEYFVKRGTEDEVTRVVFDGAEKAKPAPGVVEAIEKAQRIVICPSNPILSISPMFSITEIKDALKETRGYVIGISPIIGGKALKGPADKIMASMGLEASAYGVAKFYKDLLDHFIIDTVDENQRKKIEELGIGVTVTNTVMNTLKDSVLLAKTALEAK
jgi:LPPG:FO 2-phospho-L-lactate transferase